MSGNFPIRIVNLSLRMDEKKSKSSKLILILCPFCQYSDSNTWLNSISPRKVLALNLLFLIFGISFLPLFFIDL